MFCIVRSRSQPPFTVGCLTGSNQPEVDFATAVGPFIVPRAL